MKPDNKKRNDSHFTSRMLICAGALMAVSGVLMAVCVKLDYGGIMFASASCMFFAARSFRIAENKRIKESEENNNGKTTL